jgi:hypothetical protein
VLDKGRMSEVLARMPIPSSPPRRSRCSGPQPTASNAFETVAPGVASARARVLEHRLSAEHHQLVAVANGCGQHELPLPPSGDRCRR